MLRRARRDPPPDGAHRSAAALPYTCPLCGGREVVAVEPLGGNRQAIRIEAEYRRLPPASLMEITPMLTRHSIRATAAGLAAAIFIFFVADRADARGWSFTGGGGRTFSHTVTPYSNGGGNFGRTATTTLPDGRTRTSTFNRTNTNGTIATTRSVTGFNGQTRSSAVTRTPGQGGTATHTGRNGQTYSATTTPYNNGNGNRGRTTTVTGPDGTTTRQFTQTNNGNGTDSDTRTVATPAARPTPIPIPDTERRPRPFTPPAP